MAGSFNELFGLGSHSHDADLDRLWWLQDDAANTTLVDETGNANGSVVGGNNSEDLSVTGPNSWLTKAQSVPATADELHLGFPAVPSGGDVSVIAWFYPGWTGGYTAMFDSGVRPWSIFFNSASGNKSWGGSLFPVSGVTLGLTNGSWHHFVVSKNSDTPSYYKNGAFVVDDSDQSTGAITADVIEIGDNPSGGGADYNGNIAGLAIFNRALTSGEVADSYNGPEPVNSVAPVVTGTETEDETLSCTTGTWGIDSPFSSGSNGTITYSYQWTRSNDSGGTGEADISGATSSTYTLVTADVGKFIRCRVRATNDGGHDAAADTNSNMTGAIAAAGGGSSVSASVAATIGGATCAVSATHTAPTFSATASPSVGGIQASASGTHTTPTFAATLSPTIGGVSASASGAFTAPVYSATASPTTGGAIASVSATHTAPVYSATAAPSIGGVEVSATGVFAAVVRSATIATTTGGVTVAISGTFTAPVFSATAAPSIGGVEASAAGSFTGVARTATADPTIGGVTATAAGTFSPPVYSATASPTTGGAIASVSATHVAPSYTATVAPTIGGASVAVTATFVGHTATVDVTTGAATVAALATFTETTNFPNSTFTAQGRSTIWVAQDRDTVFTAPTRVKLWTANER